MLDLSRLNSPPVSAQGPGYSTDSAKTKSNRSVRNFATGLLVGTQCHRLDSRF